ncbi:peptidoglycan DD-metalloendopeptidase family protein [Reichenbachiella ulvae]|uniref:Peptidoglycan DD-metalloendopeptidase family protein n=1 Tax=Reichenbachiella ulvae TaxID=2980104 RepID=A0ABT3CR61_9BACT|nr:peptidoglycan DD-metalloendopeptidase family protein [Reichenbachiella ulvae]MCV9386014.1 peptidoglycan DD-metalloendopeptidase family protein [Reichenbachiella ulvae]
MMVTDTIFYLLKVSGVFIVLYSFYHLLLSRSSFHHINRVYLLAMIPVSLIIPLIDIELTSSYTLPTETIPVLFEDFGSIDDRIQPIEAIEQSHSDWNSLLALVYVLGVIVSLIKFTFNLLKVFKIKQQSSVQTDGAFTIIQYKGRLVFSYFKWIFIPADSKNTIDRLIIDHEKWHGKAWHTLDLISTELFASVLWFNPFVYLFRRDLKTVHEYQVDAAILQRDIKKSKYLQLMLNQLIDSHRRIGIYNYFNGLTMKKRIKMISKDKSTKWQLLNYLLIIPVLVTMTMSFSAPEKLANEFTEMNFPFSGPEYLTEGFPELEMMNIPFSVSEKSDEDIPSISPIKDGDYDFPPSGYGMRIHPIDKVRQFHGGLDFSAKKGTKVIVTANGVASKIEFQEGGYGRLVVIDHGGGFETRYAHLSGFAVEQGDQVQRGDVIGYVGTTGRSTAFHLHYEVRKDGKPVDPKDYM